MKYLIVLYAQYNNGTADKKAIYEVADKDEAVASFHGYMSTYMRDKTVKKVTVIAMTENGGIERDETWERTVVIEIPETVAEEVTE